MKRLLLVVGATALLVAPSRAQAQSETQNDLTIPEFRQVLLDLGSYLDAHKGTDLRARFEVVTDDVLRAIYPTVSHPRQLQSAVAALKQHDAVAAATLGRAPRAGAKFIPVEPLAAFPSCSPNSIIDTSPGALCTPAYPDPTDTAWQNLVNPLITFGAFSPTDYASVSPQQCGLTVEANLSQVSSALQGTVLAASAVCSALPPIASNVCWGANAAFSIASAVSFGLFADCSEQDGLVNAAEINAGFHNTVTIYNTLKGVDTHLTNVNDQITTEFTNLDTHVTNVDNHIAAEFGALDAHLVMLVKQLTDQISEATALVGADLKQVMKLELTPDGQRQINPAILTCTGTNCPNVLAACPAKGCSWNNVGPLP